MAVVDGPMIEVCDLPHNIVETVQVATTYRRVITDKEAPSQASLWRPDTPLKELVAQMEAAIIEEALTHSGSLKDTAKRFRAWM